MAWCLNGSRVMLYPHGYTYNLGGTAITVYEIKWSQKNTTKDTQK